MVTAAQAQPPAFHETEPNDTPASANRIPGAARIVGTMAAADQDGFLWSVSDVDALRPWTLTLQGVPGALTVAQVIRLDYAADGVTVSGRRILFTLGSRDGSRAAVAEDLLFEPGEYLLGLARAGGAAAFRPPADSVRFAVNGEPASSAASTGGDADGYRLTLEAGTLHPASGSASENRSRQQARALQPGRGLSAYAPGKESWFAVTVDHKDAANRWDLLAQVAVGRRAGITLMDAAGNKLAEVKADARGTMALPDLALATGRYLLRLDGEPDSLYSLALHQAGVRVEGEEAEPNDQWGLANRARPGSPLSGRFQRRGEDDHFAFDLSADDVERRLAVEVSAPRGQQYTVCLLDHQGRALQCASGDGEQRLGGLVLTPGVYGARLGRGSKDMAYQLRLVEDGDHDPGLEAEPNDTAERATSVPSNRRIKGSLKKDDRDFIRFDLSGPAQSWRFQVNGEGVHEVTYHDGSGKESQSVRARPDQRRVTLDNLFLLPGTHYVSVSGRADGEYTLLARPLGPPDPNGEIEPNDDTTRMQPIGIGQTRSGLLREPTDRDNYRFHLADHDRIRLTVQPPPNGAIHAALYWDGNIFRESNSGGSGEAIVLEGVFPPGDYRLELTSANPSDDQYRIDFARLERFGCPADCEPNDNPAFARPLPADGVLRGRVGEWRDEDWYALPVFAVDTKLFIVTERRPEVALLAHARDRNRLVRDDKTGAFAATVAAGEQRYLQVRGKGDYQIEVRIDGRTVPPSPARTLPLALAVDLADRKVAAYQPFGQSVDGRVELRNTGQEPMNLELLAVTSDARWRARIEPKSVRLPGGGTATAALRLAVPADAWADRPVRVSVRARDAQGAFAQAGADIVAGSHSNLVNPGAFWEIPQGLRGGFNLAWRALGGRWVGKQDDKIGSGLGDIFDGMAVREEGLALRGSHQPTRYESVVELAGSGGAEVAGFVLNPLGRRSASYYLRRFDIALSEDGKQFSTVLEGTLEPVPREQYFEFDHPHKARFARLTLIDDYSGGAGGERALGEWKVVGRPGQTPFAAAPLNLADPKLGGHVVLAAPLVSQRWDDALLNPGSGPARVRLAAGERLEWVIGFHHDRAAMIDGIEWTDEANARNEDFIERVEVSVSRDSPLGPWQRVASWKLERAKTQRLGLDQPTWARFVRFATLPAEKRRTVLAPSVVRVFERPVASGYLSILGEWGFNGHQAIFESLHPPGVPPPFEMSAHGSRDKAAGLQPGQPVQGRVWLGRHEHWYRVEIPANQNTLEIELAGDPTVRTVAAIESARGEPLGSRVVERKVNAHRIEAGVAGGETVFIRVEESPRNVVFAWDTSASVGAYLPVIYNAMSAYARDLVPGRDAANLMPFGSGLLLQDWHGEPRILQQVLNEYPRNESSSDAEGTLARASMVLAERAGAKAIVLITDAATNRDVGAWDRFHSVRPRVMALALDSHGAFGRYPVREQDLMQDWSRVNGGHYSHLRSEGEMEVAFERTASLLREPAPYRLTVNTARRDAARPGRLRVVAKARKGAPARGGDKDGASSAVAIILDASGSMLKRLNGERRIEIARRGLTEAVTRHIAPGTPVALRVFGHRQPNACRTDLEISLAPLDPKAASRTIAGIDARNLARTPIADSLAQVATDLKKHSGPKTVVLVTDGEETCDGDPEAVIRSLVDKGFDLRLNIVGFALDNQPLEQRFAQWAKLGGGSYFSADDANGFARALAAALQIPYTVFDRDGLEVARSTVGAEPIELPAGTYRIDVMSTTARIFPAVEIPAAQETVLKLE